MPSVSWMGSKPFTPLSSSQALLMASSPPSCSMKNGQGQESYSLDPSAEASDSADDWKVSKRGIDLGAAAPGT